MSSSTLLQEACPHTVWCHQPVLLSCSNVLWHHTVAVHTGLKLRAKICPSSHLHTASFCIASNTSKHSVTLFFHTEEARSKAEININHSVSASRINLIVLASAGLKVACSLQTPTHHTVKKQGQWQHAIHLCDSVIPGPGSPTSMCHML